MVWFAGGVGPHDRFLCSRPNQPIPETFLPRRWADRKVEVWLFARSPPPEREIVSLVYPLSAKAGKTSRIEGRRWKETPVLIGGEEGRGGSQFRTHSFAFETPTVGPSGRRHHFFKDGRPDLVTFDGDVWMGEGFRPFQASEMVRFASVCTSLWACG